MNQKLRILSLLSDGLFHDNHELNNICFAYSQRIGELKREGHTFETKHDEHNSAHWYWRLVKDYQQQEMFQAVNE